MNRKFYVALVAVFVGSILAWSLLPVGRIGDVVRELSGIPAIGALCLALYQIARDSIAHDRSLVVLEVQNSFSIGATSHMAIVAFDKHVAFSEEYVSSMFEILTVLFREGPCQEALDGASTLLSIRKRWSLWVTPQVEADLEGFEKALRKIGTSAYVVTNAPGSPGQNETVKGMYAQFAEVMGSKVMGAKEWDGKQITEDVALHTIIGKLRRVLGVEELTNLRARLVSQALQSKQQD
ncbi:MAG TPA: hypothetical protein VMX16_14215 [Terriglobia bacterium]|nr:hypothetical protein [Terriglobia bacterium]